MNKRTTITRKTGRKMLSIILCVIMTASVLPFTAAAEEAATEQPVLVVTGQGLIEDGVYTADNVSLEKAFTLEELKALDDLTVTRWYSSVNRFGTKALNVAEGFDIAEFFALYGYELGEDSAVTVVAADGFARTFNEASPLSEGRSYYPGIYEDDDEAEPVAAMIAWSRAVGTSEEDNKVPEEDEMEATALRLFIGQLSPEDINNSLFISNVNRLQAGGAITEPLISILGADRTRADVLLMPRAEHMHVRTNSAGEVVETAVRGVPLAVLLDELDDDAVIAFTAADGWDISNSTKAELVSANAILAYETLTDNEWAGIYRPARNDPGIVGFFALFIDGQQVLHLIDSVSAYVEPPNDWAVEEVDKALEAGLVPDSVAKAGWKSDTSRLAAAEAIALLLEKVMDASMAEIAEDKGWDLSKNPFIDTDSDAVVFLYHAGVTQGLDLASGIFGPDSEFTRAQFVTMIGRAAENLFDIDAKGDNPFTDEAPDWADQYIGYAAENGITQGLSGTTHFNPGGALQNQHTAMFVLRTFGVWS